MKRAMTLRWIALLVISVLWLAPMASVLLFSFAPPAEILKQGLVPGSWTLDNYYKVITDAGRGVSIPQAMLNSGLVLVAQVVGILLLDIPAGYAFGRLKWPGRDFLFYVVLVTMMMPGILEVLSLYDLMSQIDLVDTVYAVILPGLPRVVGIFILRQFFRELPQEMEHAARIDGATDFQVFRLIMVPLAAPAVITLAVITALYSWNNFLWPLIITNSPGSMTVPVAVAYLAGDNIAVLSHTVILAAAFFTAFPMILLFIFGQRWIITGMRPTSGIK